MEYAYRQSAPVKIVTSSTRYDNIDLIEFLALLFVIMYHSTIVKCNILDDSSIWTYINYLIWPILSTCVPLFFFSNGFLLINKQFDLKKHIIKMVRLILLTGIWGIINLLILMPIKNEWFTAKEFVIALWSWKQGWINFLWYMGALVCVYFVFPLIKNAFDHHRIIFNYWLVICSLFAFGNVILCMIATFLYHHIMGGNTYLSNNFFNMFNPFRGIYGYAFAYFSIGCFVGGNRLLIQERLKKYRFINKISLSAIILVSTLLLGLWGIYSTRLTGKEWGTVWNGYDTVFTLINVLAIYLISNQYNYTGGSIGKYIQLVSQNTLGIYFIHELFLHLFDRMGIKLLPIANNYLFSVVYALFVMTLCLLITLLIKRIPIAKWLVM